MLEACQRATKLTPNHARSLLGQFLFSGEEAEKPLDGLSGGERQRLSLAILVHSGANVLILDEPTNHLDLESREALEDGAAALPGRAAADLPRPRAAGRGRHAHGRARGPDAALLRRRLARVRARARGARRGRARRPSAPSRRRSRRRRPRSRRRRSRSKNEQARAKKLEAEIERAEAALAALEVELADPGAWNDPRAAAKSTARHAEAKKTLEELYARWEVGRRLARQRRSSARVMPVASAARLAKLSRPTDRDRVVDLVGRADGLQIGDGGRRRRPAGA